MLLGCGIGSTGGSFQLRFGEFLGCVGEDNILKMAFSLWRTGFAAVGCT